MAQEFTRNRITLNASSGSALVIGASDSDVLKTVHTVPASAQDTVVLEIVTGANVTESFEVSIYKNDSLIKTLAVVGGKKSAVEINNLQAGDLIKIKHPLSLSINTSILPDTPSVTDGYKWFADAVGPKAGDQNLSNAIALASPGYSPTNVYHYHYYPAHGIAIWFDNSTYNWHMYDAVASSVVSSVQNSTYYPNTERASFSDNWIFAQSSSYQYSVAVDLAGKTLSTGWGTSSGSSVYYSSSTNNADIFIHPLSSNFYAKKFAGTSYTNVASLSLSLTPYVGDIQTFSDGNTYAIIGGSSSAYIPEVIKWDGTAFTRYSSSSVSSGVTIRMALAIPSRNELWLFGYNNQDGAANGSANAYKFSTSTNTWTKYTDAISTSDGFSNLTTERKCFYSSDSDIIWISTNGYGSTNNEFLGFDPDTQDVTRAPSYFYGPNTAPAASSYGFEDVLGSGSGEYYTFNLNSNGPYIKRASDGAVYHDSSRSDRGGAYSTSYGPLSLHVASSTMYRFEDNRNVYLYDVGSTPMTWRSSDTTAFSAYSTSSTYARVRFNWVDNANNKLYYTDYWGTLYSFDINASTGALSNNTLIGTATNFSVAVPGASESYKFRPIYLPSSGYFVSYNGSTGYLDVGDVVTDTKISSLDTSPYSVSGFYSEYRKAIGVYTENSVDYCVFTLYYGGTYYLKFFKVDANGTITNIGDQTFESIVPTFAIASWVDTGSTTYPHRVLFSNGTNVLGRNFNMKTGQRDSTNQTTHSKTSFVIDDNPYYLLSMPYKYAIGAAVNNATTSTDQYIGGIYYSPPSAAGVGSLSVSPGIVNARMSDNPYTIDTFDQSTTSEKNDILSQYSTKTDGYVNRVTTTA